MDMADGFSSGGFAVRFLMTVNGDGRPPDKELFAEMGRFAEELRPGPRHARAAGRPGPYVLQAAIAACHAQPHTPEQTDWARIATLYQAFASLTPSPAVELNRFRGLQLLI
jgi:hypothetical protein